MQKIKIAIANDMIFPKGCDEYILNCKARNMRETLMRKLYT